MTEWQPTEITSKEQVLSAMELLLTAKQINYVKSQTFAGPSKIAVIRRLINIGIQVEATDEIERLREELKRVNDGIDAFKDSIKWKHDNWLKIKPIFEQNKQPLNHKYEDIPSRFSKFFDNPALKEGE